MATAKIVIKVDGASRAAIARLANDVWARLSDPTHGADISVSVEGDVTSGRLNRDYEARYGAPGDWLWLQLVQPWRAASAGSL